ncbi:MAG TPA: hypothetical protein VHN74_12020 [Candidatus Angelobacter sp.]|jgi:hypothetical protein|nr:hypothetical protein [Candidatus Angelobacter sp.]
MAHRLFIAAFGLLLASTACGAQAGSSAPSQAGGASPEKQKAESECMKWAKQQAGIEQAQGAQGSAQGETAETKGGAQGAEKGADQSAQQSAQQGSQQTAASGLSGAAASAAGSLGGATNSKAAEIVKEAYTKCMQKKGFSTK